jgi:hypothetical protein
MATVPRQPSSNTGRRSLHHDDAGGVRAVGVGVADLAQQRFEITVLTFESHWPDVSPRRSEPSPERAASPAGEPEPIELHFDLGYRSVRPES